MRYAYWHPTGADDQRRFIVGVKRTGIQIALAVLLPLDTRDLHQIHQGNIALEAIEFGVSGRNADDIAAIVADVFEFVEVAVEDIADRFGSAQKLKDAVSKLGELLYAA